MKSAPNRASSMKTLSLIRSCVVLKISDLGSSQVPLQEQIRPAIHAAPFVVIDVDGIHFTSMMLGEIVNVYMEFSRRWQGHAHGLALIRAPEVTRQIVRVAKLADKLVLYDDLEAAWRAFGAPAGTQV
jgi:hypothetical protein